MYTIVESFLQNESGSTAVEYGLIAGLVSMSTIGALALMGGSLDSMFIAAHGHLDAAVAGMPAIP